MIKVIVETSSKIDKGGLLNSQFMTLNASHDNMYRRCKCKFIKYISEIVDVISSTCI